MSESENPNPGSREAIALGCRCPVIDNGHGRNGPPFWIRDDCPLHGARHSTRHPSEEPGTV